MKPKFSLTDRDPRLTKFLQKTDQKILAQWARDCAERVLPYFECAYPRDSRPRQAIQALQAWIDTGIFSMTAIRQASLNSHAAARDVEEDSPARSAARAAGQAVATAHVRTHAVGAATYAVQAIYRASDPQKVEALMTKERDWQYRHLQKLTQGKNR